MIKITPARRAARAPPFTLHRDCSHHQYNISAHARSSPRGIGILAPAPRCDQRAGGRRTRRTPPKLATHRARTRHGTLAGSFRSSSLRTTSQQPPPRLRAGHGLGHGAGGCGQVPMGAGCCAPPPSEPRGPDSPRAASPAQSRATRYGPIQTRQLRRQNAATFPHIRNLACVRGNSAREFGPRRFPALPGPAREGEPGGTPLGSPEAALRRARPQAERRTAGPVPCW